MYKSLDNGDLSAAGSGLIAFVKMGYVPADRCFAQVAVGAFPKLVQVNGICPQCFGAKPLVQFTIVYEIICVDLGGLRIIKKLI